MSCKHFFSNANSLVPSYLKGFVRVNPDLSLVEEERVVYNPHHSKKKVSLVSGGGSGHEPAWSSYVGDGMLTAAVNGDIFASPSAKQVMAGIDASPSDEGIILLITNYTGDKLHFGLACEKAKTHLKNKKVTVLSSTDDVALGRQNTGMVGRRGLAANVVLIKLLGAAAEAGKPYEYCVELGKAINDNMATMGSSLDHCHVPGRINHEAVPEDEVILGMGIHNEKGFKSVSPIPPADELIKTTLDYLLDPNDENRNYLNNRQKGDKFVLLVNNFGGVSALELGALTNEAIDQLESTWDITPHKIFSGHFEASLNGPGFSVSLVNVSAISRDTKIDVQELVDFLEAPTSAPGWPGSRPNVNKTPEFPYKPFLTTTQLDETKNCKIDPEVAKKTILQAAHRAIESEPKLTEWDMVMGDGDCGETVKEICQDITKKVNNGLTDSGNLLAILHDIIASVENMGGTLGAIIAIFLSAFTAELESFKEVSSDAFAASAKAGIEALFHHTGARVGDRTVMDTLIPFCTKLHETSSFKESVTAAKEGAEYSAKCKAKFGRATYVQAGQEGVTEIPDPGAWALYEVVQGIQDALN
ncbi:hypothetical protein TRICI_004839 [Trichomonascus ciferrii]|uniref:Uncharacterized protein n=1 Tax=Trichomonascus ciferrii TaxID=44093 RepID=A0A642UYZ0_9ASCO|nr:hypothetical protein TRICI_004839 [Trichomonascus ciferrii]